MATRITVPIQNIEGTGSQYFDIDESIEEVIKKLVPVEQPSPEQVHENLKFTRIDGRQVFILPTDRGWWLEELQ